VQEQRFWNFEPNTIRYSSPDQYAEHLRDVFRAAVESRLRSRAPVWAELSGGLDSSSIVCMASRLQRVDAPAIQPVSAVFPDSPESDESGFVERVDRWCGLRSLRLASRHDATSLEDLAAGIGPVASSPRLSQTAAHMRRCGASVLLSGELGDLVMAKNSQHATGMLEHLVEHHRPGLFLREAWRWSERTRKPLWGILPTLLMPLLPATRAEAIRHARLRRVLAKGHGASGRDTASTFALAPDFIRRHGPSPRSFAEETRRFPRAKEAMARGLYWWMDSPNLTTPDDEPDVRVTFPFAHRPLVEYVLAIPETVLWEPGNPRALMRRAFAGFMPRTIVQRRYKGYAVPAMTRLLRPVAVALARDLDRSQLVARGIVDVAPFRRQLEGLIDGSLSNVAHVATLLTVESWLRRQERTIAHETSGDDRAQAPAATRAR
jgi:asparagine synthase (glutamine-hydrolysing)